MRLLKQSRNMLAACTRFHHLGLGTAWKCEEVNAIVRLNNSVSLLVLTSVRAVGLDSRHMSIAM